MVPNVNRLKTGSYEKGKKTSQKILVNIFCVLLQGFKRDIENIYLIMPELKMRTHPNIH